MIFHPRVRALLPVRTATTTGGCNDSSVQQQPVRVDAGGRGRLPDSAAQLRAIAGAREPDELLDRGPHPPVLVPQVPGGLVLALPEGPLRQLASLPAALSPPTPPLPVLASQPVEICLVQFGADVPVSPLLLCRFS